MVGTGLAAMIALAAAARPADDPGRLGQLSYITRAAFAEGRLWMRTDASVLVSVAPSESRLRAERVPAPVLDLCTRNGRLLTVSWDARKWNVWRHEGSGWALEAAFDAGDAFIGLVCSPDAVTLVTATEVLVAEPGGRVRASRLSRPLTGPFTAAFLTNLFIDHRDLYVGLNGGEWGGGLLRVRLSDGDVSLVERGICGGPPVLALDTAGERLTRHAACDPVHAIAPLPWKPGCVAIAVGLVHLVLVSGRLVEICGESVRTLVAREMPAGRVGMSVPFFGVTASDGELVAVGLDGVYRVSERSVERHSLPAFRDVGGIRVSFGVPGLALVLTDVNARRSVSGSIPMLVRTR